MTVDELRYAIVRVFGAPSRELAALDALIGQSGPQVEPSWTSQRRTHA